MTAPINPGNPADLARPIASFFPADMPQLVYIRKDGTEVLITGVQFTPEQEAAFQKLKQDHQDVLDFTICLDTLVGIGTQGRANGKRVLVDYLTHPQYDADIDCLRNVPIGGKQVNYLGRDKLKQDRVTTSDKLEPAFERKRHRTTLQKVWHSFRKVILRRKPEPIPQIEFTEGFLKTTIQNLADQQQKIRAIEEFHATRFVLQKIKENLLSLKGHIHQSLNQHNLPENVKSQLNSQQATVDEALEWFDNKLDQFAVCFGGTHREVPLDQRKTNAQTFLGLLTPQDKEREKVYIQNLQVADKFDNRIEYHNTCLAQGITQTSLTDEHYIIAAAHQLLGAEPNKAADFLQRMPIFKKIQDKIPAGGLVAARPIQLDYAQKLAAQRQAENLPPNASVDDLIQNLHVDLGP